MRSSPPARKILKKPPLVTAPARQTQEARSEKSRAKILIAAERVFAREGLAGARTDAIAAEAGVNKALLYYYFKSKEALYDAVVEEHLRDFNRIALAILQAPGPAGPLMLRYVDMHFDFISQRHRHAQLFQQFMTNGGTPPERLVREYILPRVEALRSLLVRGIRQGEFRKADPFHTSVSIVSVIMFYFSAAPMLQLIGHSDPYAPASLARRKKEARDFIRHGLFAHPETSEK
jgi:TetR/AcrR family transcriptional regulator